MLLSSFFLNLERRNIDSGDIRQLLLLNPSRKGTLGLISSLTYWLQGKRTKLPTQLRVVYCLENQKMVALPFLDKTIDTSKIWGIELDKFFLYKKELRVKSTNVSKALKKCSYGLDGMVRLPTYEEMREICGQCRGIQSMKMWFERYDMDFDRWSCTSYWIQSLEPPSFLGISTVKDYFSCVRQEATESKRCFIRPVCDKVSCVHFGTLDKYGLPDKISEEFAKELRKK